MEVRKLALGRKLLAFASALAIGGPSVAADNPSPSPSPDAYTDRRGADVVNWRREVTLAFAGGSQFVLTLRRTPAVIVPVTNDFSTELPVLRKLADSGDADAAHAVFVGLRVCSSAYPNEAGLAEAISKLRNEGILVVPGRAAVSVSKRLRDAGTLERSALIEPFEFCRGVSAADRDALTTWRDRAALGGNVWALKDIATRSESSGAIEAWSSVWRQGSMSALGKLASLHGFGDVQVSKITDPKSAYAYATLYAQLFAASSTVIPGTIRTGQATELMRKVDAFGNSIGAQARIDGESLAVELLASNPRCCFID